MINRKSNIVIALVSSLFILAGCSTEKDALLNKGYHNMTARYNGYYNARVIIDESLEAYRLSYDDNYNKILPLDVYPSEEDAPSLYPQMDVAIEKCETVILRHSMPNPLEVKNKEVENCRWIDDNWLVIAKIHYIKREYELAGQKFKYITESEYFQTEESIYEAKIWLAKVHIANGNYPEAKRLLAEVKISMDEETARRDMSIAEKLKERKSNKKRRKKNKKKGIKEPARFPKKLTVDYEITMADLYIQQGDYKNAIEHLENGIAVCKDKKQKARYMFVLAQLYEKQGNGDLASHYYNKVAHSNAPYEMQFKAKINKALSATTGGEELRKELRKMLRDGKNLEYKDQIYYALAEMDMKEGNVDDAKLNYSNSAFFSIENDRQKGTSYLRLADIYFSEKNYLKAQKYYDSCVQVLPKDHEDFKSISSKASGLSDLVFNYETVVFEDSVQMIAGMSEKEREKFLEKTAQDIKEENARKKAEAEQRLLEQQQRVNNQTNNNTQGGSKWYFYNQKVKGSGFNDFRSLWGQRTLEDNWRRANKTSYTDTENIDGADEDSLNSEEVGGPSVEELRANIPLTPGAVDSSNHRLLNSLYALGIIYKEQLDEIDEAEDYFNQVVDRGIEHPKVLPALYQLYLIHQKKGSGKAGQYKEKILKDYPDSEIAQILKDPDYLRKQEEKKLEELNEYQACYRNYEYRKFGPVVTKCNDVIRTDSSNKYLNKYYLLKAFAISKITPGNTDAIKSPLQELYDRDPQSEEGIQAKIYLGMLNEGQSITNMGSGAADNRFIINMESQHFFIVVIPNTQGNINPFKIKLSNFNQEYFRNSDLKITNAEMGPRNQILIVRTFENFAAGKPYLSTYKTPQSQLLLGTMASDFMYFMINKKNFGELSTTKNVEAYFEFYKTNYPQN